MRLACEASEQRDGRGSRARATARARVAADQARAGTATRAPAYGSALVARRSARAVGRRGSLALERRRSSAEQQPRIAGERDAQRKRRQREHGARDAPRDREGAIGRRRVAREAMEPAREEQERAHRHDRAPQPPLREGLEIVVVRVDEEARSSRVPRTSAPRSDERELGRREARAVAAMTHAEQRMLAEHLERRLPRRRVGRSGASRPAVAGLRRAWPRRGG